MASIHGLFPLVGAPAGPLHPVVFYSKCTDNPHYTLGHPVQQTLQCILKHLRVHSSFNKSQIQFLLLMLPWS